MSAQAQAAAHVGAPVDAAARAAVDLGPLDRLDGDAVERVLRRAVQLDEDTTGEDHRISVRALLEAADELGIDPSDVRQAVVEEQLGLLAARRRPADPLVGPDRFVVARVVEGSPGAIAERIDDWMRRGRVLRRSRSPQRADGAAGWVEYARRNDPMAGVQRAMHALQGHERLAHVRRVRVVVSPLEDRRCVVGLLVDAARSRRVVVAGATATTVSGSLLSLDWVVSLGHPWPLAIGGAALSAMAGAGVLWSRRVWTDGVEGDLEGLLDAVESGGRPPSAIGGLTSRVMRPARPRAPRP